MCEGLRVYDLPPSTRIQLALCGDGCDEVVAFRDHMVVFVNNNSK